MDKKSKPTVVLLHGLGRTWTSMVVLGSRLRRRGFAVVNMGYAARRQTIEQSAAEIYEKLKSRDLQTQELVFVGHSLGGIVVRYLLTVTHPEICALAVVMLGSPNQGSSLARKVSRFCGKIHPNLARSIFGPALNELENLTLPPWPANRPLCLIAGGCGTPRGALPFVSGDNDGIVSVEETRLHGAQEHVVVPHVHTFLMYQRGVTEKIISFISAVSLE